MNFSDFGIAVDGRGEQKTVCPQCSESRKKSRVKCLNVNVDEGVWNCWHCGWSGSLKVKREQRYEPVKTYVKPEAKSQTLSESALAWLNKRGITKAVAERNKLHTAKVYMPQLSAEVVAIGFPYFRNGELINCKWRDKDKNFRLETGAERLVYGYDDIEDTTIIVEGEMDKLAVEVAGFKNCISVPDGAPAPNAKNIESKFDFLADDKIAAVKRWIVAVDNDAPGQRLQQELIRRFGPERCLVVSWLDGAKDANDMLMQFGARALREAVERAKHVPVAGIYNGGEFVEDFLNMYDEGVPSGFTTGWEAIDEYFRVWPGQLTVVTGIPGHGKSEFIDALAVNFAQKHGWRTAFYSPENYPVKLHLMKLAEKYVGKPYNQGPHNRMTAAEAVQAADWLREQFFWIMPDTPSLDEIMGKAKALVARHGVRVLVIDPWNEVEHNRPAGMTEAEYVSQSLMRLRRMAREHELSVFVVAHPRLIEKRLDGTYPTPTPYDISGGANWRNKADNCIAVYTDVVNGDGNVEIHIQKVKFKLFGRVGMANLQWNRVTGQYQ